MKKENFNDQVAEYWNGNAEVWADHVNKGYDKAREYINNPSIFRLIGDVEGRRVLDAGCGEGYNTRILARQGALIEGCDISSKMIEYAREKEKEEPLGIKYRITSYTDLSPYENESFDLIVSFMALMDGSGYEKAVSEFYRVLKPGGRLIFSVLHPCFLSKGYGWIKDEETGDMKLTVSDYFDKTPFLDVWHFSMAPDKNVKPFNVLYFPLTLSDYFNTLADAGFRLERIEEPRPEENDSRLLPGFQKWRKHAANFLQIKAVKV